jgi:hypothetical protein
MQAHILTTRKKNRNKGEMTIRRDDKKIYCKQKKKEMTCLTRKAKREFYIYIFRQIVVYKLNKLLNCQVNVIV